MDSYFQALNTVAGLNSGYNTGYYTIPGSRSIAIGNISHTSNVNVTGRWAFRVDKLHPEDVNGNIDNSTDIPVVSTTTQVPVYTSRNHSTVPPFISSSDLLYPYGSAIDTINPKSDDGSSSIIRLSTAIPLFGSNYSSLYVNNNGLLSFRLPIGQWTPQELPVAFGNPFLALFWADINNQIAGDIYFRQSTDPVLLYRATSDIRAYFHHLNFTAQWVFVATWDSVAYFGSATNKVNTFQAVLCTDGNYTFVLLNYEDIQWPSVEGNSSVYFGPFALVGLNSGYNTGYYTIPGSRSPAIGNISHTTNVNVTGRWAFRVDKLHPEDVNGNIDNSTDIPVVSTTTQVPVYTSRNHSTVPPFISSSDLLYPYGSAIDTINPKSDDGSSSIIRLSTAIPLFGSNYSSLYVNNNGLLSFRSPIGQYVPQELPVAFGNPFLALFWADINNQVAGDIYFRQSTDPALLYRATSDIRAYFHHLNFTAQWVFVATWDSVAYYGSATNKVNTFQAVLITDQNATFVLFNYGAIEWTTGTASGGNNLTGLGGIPALAGINSGYNIGYYIIPGSLSSDIVNISSTSNVNVAGRWAFRVDKTQPEGANVIIDGVTSSTAHTSTRTLQADIATSDTISITPTDTTPLETISIHLTDTIPLDTTSTPPIDTTQLDTISTPPTYTTSLDTTNSPPTDTTSLDTISTPPTDTIPLDTISTPLTDTIPLDTTSTPPIDTTPLGTSSTPLTDTTSLDTISSPLTDTTSLDTISIPLYDTMPLYTISTTPADTTPLETISTHLTDTISLDTTSTPPIYTMQFDTVSTPPTYTTSLDTISTPPTDTTSLNTISTPPIDSTSLDTISTPPTDTTPLDTISTPLTDTLPLDNTSPPPIDSTSLDTISTPPTDTTPLHATSTLPTDSTSLDTTSSPPTDTTPLDTIILLSLILHH
ncbi:uncharacterized protein LOC142107450 [Mixophyes fleayi]|uniref:uncharacterized protein LOC142107450 n=1 Tax=Mixophyes fleayi TaxID=3061075 RepID=UPI003F4D7E89